MVWGLTLAALQCACSIIEPLKPPAAASQAAARWQAPLPATSAAAGLQDWWNQFDDPALMAVVGSAVRASADLMTATARIERARAQRVAAEATLLPTLDAELSAGRGRPDNINPLGNRAQGGLRTSWEIDLFGAAQANAKAQQARFEGLQAAWYSTRIALAAEAANSYLSLRACEAQATQADSDARSRIETARVSGQLASAGLLRAESAEIARASASQAREQVNAREAQCDRIVKSIVALTALDEEALRRRLSRNRGQLPAPAPLTLPEVPAQLLAQRPDLVEAELAVAAAAADDESARARRLPQVTLVGWLGRTRTETDAFTVIDRTWQFGPLVVTFPIFDGGTRRANAAAARAEYDAAVARYQARLRNAVREVEEALVTLSSTENREADARRAAEGFAASLRSVETRHRAGLATVFELEESRRSALGARTALIELQRSRVTAWIDLYRAMGGGWSRPQYLGAPPPVAASSDGEAS